MRLNGKRISKNIVVLFLIVYCGSYIYSENQNSVLLSDVAKKIDQYKGRSLNLRLRFKHFDDIFNKISFYDIKNIDIVFDTINLRSKESFKNDAVNLHEGMEYMVRFNIHSLDNMGLINGDLIEFKSLLMDKIPDGN